MLGREQTGQIVSRDCNRLRSRIDLAPIHGLKSITTACLATEAEIQSATWLAGWPSLNYGLCITKPRLVIKFASAAQASQEAAAIRFIRRQCRGIPAPEVLGT